MADEKPQTVERHTWDRRPDESRRAFSAFVLFRDSDDRRLKTVAAGLKPPCSIANVGRWCIRHSWHSRACDWDNHVDEEMRAELARGRTAARKRKLAIAEALQGLSAHVIREWQDKIRMGLPLSLPLETAALLAKAADALEQSALGPMRENSFAKIVVNLGEATPLDDEQTTVLCDDTTGDGFDGEKPKVN